MIDAAGWDAASAGVGPMAEELQSLIDKIHREGLERAEREAVEILTKARSRADEIVREAEARAKELMAAGEREAERSVARGTRSLEQAARDVILSVGGAVTRLLEGIVAARVGAELSGGVLREGIGRILGAYAERGMAEGRVEVLLSGEDLERLRGALMSEFAGVFGEGFEVGAEEGLASGFKVRLEGGRVVHDFSPGAIADAISRFLRPGLAEVAQRAARDLRSGEGG